MTPVFPSRALYLDTNAFVYAHFYLTRPSDVPDVSYFQRGEQVVRCLGYCRDRVVRVFSTDLAYLEMHHNYFEWARLRKGLELNAPLGLLFGKTQRDDKDKRFLEQLGPSVQQMAFDATAGWLQDWAYHELVEFKQPYEIPNWFRIARHIYARHMETVLDCLHLAAAIALECEYFLTQDRDLRRLLSRMREDSNLKEALIKECGVSDTYSLPDGVSAHSFDPPEPRAS